MEIDILNIDKNIRDKWKLNEDKMNEINTNISEMNEILKDLTLSLHIIKDLKAKIIELEKEKKEYENYKNNLNFYIMDVTPILETYKKNVKPKKISFMSKKENNNETRSIVKQYLEILENYNISYEELNEIVSTNNKSPVKKKECKKCLQFKNQNKFVTNFFINNK